MDGAPWRFPDHPDLRRAMVRTRQRELELAQPRGISDVVHDTHPPAIRLPGHGRHSRKA